MPTRPLAWMLLVLACLPAPAAQDSPEVIDTIAFGSCADQERPQPIWDAVVAADPDLFLFLGDNIYGDSEDLKVLQAKYQKLARMPGYQKLLGTCPVLATWDDHDLGVNDGGREYPRRKESQQLFLDFFNVPKDSPRRGREGVYTSAYFGPPEKRVQVILLDTRYFRSPLKRRPSNVAGEGPYMPDVAPEATMLGEEQWEWLEQELRQPARLRLIGSSVQVVAEDHGWEKWMNMPNERKRLYKTIRDTRANGVVFLSGDRHLAELSMMNGGVGYPLYDLTSSGLNQGAKQWRPLEANRHRVATMNVGNNFGLIQVDWDRPDPLVRLQIRDEAGDVTIQQKVPLSVLQAGSLLPAGSARARLAGGGLLDKEAIDKHSGEEIRIVMEVRSTGVSTTKGYTFLNSAQDYSSPDNFTVVLTKEATEDFKAGGVEDPREHFIGRTIEVSGTLQLYRKTRPEILVEDPQQIRVVEQ